MYLKLNEKPLQILFSCVESVDQKLLMFLQDIYVHT